MTSYKLVITKSAKKDIDRLDSVVRRQIARKLQFYISQKDPLIHAKQLVSPRLGSHRYRVGHYRVVFDIDKDKIVILSVKHRKDIYRK